MSVGPHTHMMYMIFIHLLRCHFIENAASHSFYTSLSQTG